MSEQTKRIVLLTVIVACIGKFASTSLFAGELRGRVVDEVTGKPAAEVLVTVQATKQSVGWGKAETATHETRTDADGNYQVAGLAPSAYNVWAVAADRTCRALNSISVKDDEVRTTDDLRLIEGNWIEGRVVTLQGEPVSRDPKTGERLRIELTGPARPRSGVSFESVSVGDDGRFRLRVPPGRNFPRILSPELWEHIWVKEKYERGIDVDAGQPVTLNFRVVEQGSKRPLPPRRPVRDPVNLPPPVLEEWDCAETIRDLGGWYHLDDDRHVVEVNMVYNDETGKRFDNQYANTDEALRIAPAFTRLKRLYLHQAQATDDSLACLVDLKGLETFFVWDAVQITDVGAKHFANLKNLQSLHFSNSKTGDAVIEAISKLEQLKRVSMQSNNITDEGLAHFAEMKEVTSIWIGMSKGKITDAGVVHLVGLDHLTELDLQHSKLTDEGLETLAELKNLQRLYLGGSDVTNDGLNELRKVRPNLKIIK